MDTRTFITIILYHTTIVNPAIVKWLPNSSFNLPTNFIDQKLPCGKRNVVFPDTLTGSVGLESAVDVASLILPEDGEIVLDDALIALGVEGVSNCTEGNSYYLDGSISSWMDAGAWSSSRFTKATPDNERLPCFDDVVEFPGDAKYAVSLPSTEQTVRGLKIGNQSFDTNSFLTRVQKQSDEMHQFQLNIYYGTGVSVKLVNCQHRFGCSCQAYPPRVDCAAKFCVKPSCVAPIKPKGYCCSFCGGSIMFDVDEAFDMISFKETVNKVIDGYADTLVSHISVVENSPAYKVQLVVMDEGEYTGISAEAITVINKEIKSHWFKNDKFYQISGTPLYKKGLGAKLFVSMFFAVSLVLGGIYVYYYKLPDVRLPIRGGMFSRFQNRSDSVISLTRRDSTVVPAPRTAFRNPLYDSKRGRVQVEESTAEE